MPKHRRRNSYNYARRILLALIVLTPILLLPVATHFLPAIGSNSVSSLQQNLINPSQPGFNLTGIAFYYSQVLGAVAKGENASAIISNFPPSAAPQQFNEDIVTANQLIGNLTRDLKTSGHGYYLAISKEEFGYYTNSSAEISYASSNISAANMTYSDLEQVFTTLGTIGVPINIFQNDMKAIGNNVTVLSLEIHAESILVANILQGAIPTANLTVSVQPSALSIGQSATVSGYLQSQGSPLSNQSVSLFYMGSKLGVVRTNQNGLFQFNFVTPKTYSSNPNLTATFAPTLDYAPTMSTARVNIIYYTFKANITSMPESVVSGKSYYINGIISANLSSSSGGIQLPAPAKQVEASIFGQTIFITYDGTPKPFSFQFVVPANDTGGSYDLRLNSSADSAYAPFDFSSSITLIKQPIYLELANSNISFFDTTSGFSVQGLASYGSLGNQTTLSSGTVIMALDGREYQTTLARDGSFIFNVRPNIESFLLGGTYSVTIYPSQAVIESSSTTHSFQGILSDPDKDVAGSLIVLLLFCAIYFVLIDSVKTRILNNSIRKRK